MNENSVLGLLGGLFAVNFRLLAGRLYLRRVNSRLCDTLYENWRGNLAIVSPHSKHRIAIQNEAQR